MMRTIVVVIDDEGVYKVEQEEKEEQNKMDILPVDQKDFEKWFEGATEEEIKERAKDTLEFWSGFDKFLEENLGDKYRELVVEYATKKADEWIIELEELEK